MPILGRKMCRGPEESIRLVQCLGAAAVSNHLKESVPPPVDGPAPQNEPQQTFWSESRNEHKHEDDKATRCVGFCSQHEKTGPRWRAHGSPLCGKMGRCPLCLDVLGRDCVWSNLDQQSQRLDLTCHGCVVDGHHALVVGFKGQ